MSISSIGQTTSAMVKASAQIVNSSSNNTESISKQKNADTVSITKTAADTIDFELDSGKPSWFTDTNPPKGSKDLALLSAAIEETESYLRMHSEAKADGKVTRGEKKAIDSYFDTMQNNKTAKENTVWRGEHRSELVEYKKLQENVMSDMMKELGIESTSLFFSNFKDNQAIGNKFKESLASNPRAAELMDILGVENKSL